MHGSTIMQGDILNEVFTHLHHPLIFNTFPMWKALLNRDLFDHGRFMCGLALVCRAWVQAARRVALRHVVLHISPRQAPVFLELVQKDSVGLLVKTLVLDFPLVHEQMCHNTVLTFIRDVIDACPNITSLHLDNIPSSLAAFPRLISHITSPLITSLGMRSIGPYSSSTDSGFMPYVSVDLPHLPRLRQLALWGYNIGGITDASQHPSFSGLRKIHLYLCHISDSFLHSLAALPLRHLFIGKNDLDVSTLGTVLQSSSMLEAFEYHFLVVGGNVLSDSRAVALGLTGKAVIHCEHPLGYTSKAAERRTKMLRQRESGNYTDHCYALGFEIPVSSAIDLSLRTGAELRRSNINEPLWMVLREMHNLEAYLTSHVKQQIHIVQVHLPVPPPRPSAPFRLYACYQVVPLLGAQLARDITVPVKVDERSEMYLKGLLGCPESPTEEYFLQNVQYDFAVPW